MGWIRTQGHTCPGQRPWEQSSRPRPLPPKEMPPHTSLRANNSLSFLLKSLQDVSCREDKDAGKQITTYRDDEKHSSLSYEEETSPPPRLSKQAWGRGERVSSATTRPERRWSLGQPMRPREPGAVEAVASRGRNAVGVSLGNSGSHPRRVCPRGTYGDTCYCPDWGCS